MSKKVRTFAAETKQAAMKPAFFLCINAPQVFERASSVPCPALVPNEAMSIKEMLIRTERGQRLDIHTRMRNENCPDDMYSLQELEQMSGLKYDPNDPSWEQKALQKMGDQLENTPPDGIHDIVDVYNYQKEQEQRKRELQERRKKTVANATKSAPVEKPQEKKEPHVEKPKEEA